ncbi:MAG: cell filamentation protein Fic [Muribaculaceae bacterium]|nr:cell filamentation protein Fic [Muribaculaceae bacterium]
MANLQEKLADSLRALKEFQDNNKNPIIKGMKELGDAHTKRLLQNGYLEQVIKGWYMPSMPGLEGDTTTWYASYWSFISAYCYDRFGENWCLTPEESLDYYAGDNAVPSQLIIRSPKASNNINKLKHNDSLLDISASLPGNVISEQTYGLKIYSLAEALSYCSPDYFRKSPINARTCLSLLNSADEILKVVADEGNTTRASRIVGALKNIGRNEMADEITSFMTKLGHTLRPEDPFEDKAEYLIRDEKSISPYALRIKLMWERMRNQIKALDIKPQDKHLNIDAILTEMEVNYVRDSYHSLSIEGYRVTESLIERVRSGKWDPKNSKEDTDRKNALAARGYFQAFQKVKESVKDILQGARAGEVVSKHFDDWHFTKW